MASLINKARKPKFELHLTIYDLNNVPLVSGASYVKWYLPHSIHAEHRGRTAKCAMDKPSHRVTYNYSKIVPIRISIDRNNHLTDCPIEFEVLQELPSAPGGKDERIALGVVRLNLSEYVEESENFPRRPAGASRLGANFESARDKIGQGLSHRRLSSKSSAGAGGANISPTSTNSLPQQQTPPPQQQQQQQPHPEENDVVDEDAEEGIVRRYLMQDSKINSTLKIGILMVQVDGERNYVAPPLKTAPMFSGITGITAGDAASASSEPVDDAASGGGGARPRTSGGMTSLSKSRDVSEVQDMYRRALAASWSCQPGELPADECIEDIFSGGDGWRRSHDDPSPASRRLARGGGTPQMRSPHRLDGGGDDESVNSASHSNSNSNSGSGSGSGSASPDDAAKGTLRPSDVPRIHRHSRRQSGSSNHSDRSARSGLTVVGERDSHSHPRSRPFYTHSSQQQYHHDLSSSSSSSHFHFNFPFRSGGGGGGGGGYQHLRPPSSRGREDGLAAPQHDGGSGSGILHRSGSIASLAPTLGGSGSGSGSSRSSSDRGRSFGGFRRQKEVDEHEIREDLVAWKLPGTAAVT